MSYVDGYVIPIRKSRLAAYRKMALEGKRMWKKHGALDYKECAGDDLKAHFGMLSFSRLLRLKPGETVVFAYVVFKNRAHRDRVNARVMKEFSEMGEMPEMPFDPKRMAVGGFKTLVE